MSCTVSTSAFTRLEEQFQILTNCLHPLAVDGLRLGHGLPEREVPLDELRERLLDGGASPELKQAAWAELAHRAQHGCPEWTIGAIGMMLPGLQGIARRLIHGPGDVLDADDLRSEILMGFLEALRKVDSDRPAIASRLWWAAYGRGLAARRAALDDARQLVPGADIGLLEVSGAVTGSPDRVLEKAVSARVITAGDADLIGATRIEREPLQHAADRLGIGYQACRLRRWRAERDLSRHLGRTRPRRTRRPAAASVSVAA